MKKRFLLLVFAAAAAVLASASFSAAEEIDDSKLNYIHLSDGYGYYSDEIPAYEEPAWYPQANAVSGYLLPDPDRKLYTPADIRSMNLQVVCYAKNEIYARHGRKFVSKELQDYFNSQRWYTGTTEAAAFSESVMNQTELNNVDLLLNRERELSGGALYALDRPGYNYDAPYNYISGTGYYDDVPAYTPAPPAPAPYTGFNILSGLRLVNTGSGAWFEADHFRLTLPNVENYSHAGLDNNSFEIYYVPARNDGFGGKVVTIRAYDSYDTSYQYLPSWKICGRAGSRVYVAIYPTDLQCNPARPAQVEAYKSLYYWAQKLNENITDGSNPFTCWQ